MNPGHYKDPGTENLSQLSDIVSREGLEPKSAQGKDDAAAINLSQQSQQSPEATQDHAGPPDLPSQPDIPMPAATASEPTSIMLTQHCKNRSATQVLQYKEQNHQLHAPRSILLRRVKLAMSPGALQCHITATAQVRFCSAHKQRWLEGNSTADSRVASCRSHIACAGVHAVS